MTIDIDREFETALCSCDYCSFTEDHDTSSFVEVIRAMKRDGWRVEKDDEDDWMHKCPICIEKERKEMRKLLPAPIKIRTKGA